MYPDYSFARRQEAGALAALGRIDEVDRLLDEAFAVYDEFSLVDLLFVTGHELRAHGWREASVQVGERWLAWLDAYEETNPSGNPDHPLWRTSRARALELTERWDEARVIWEGLVAEEQEIDFFGKLFSLGTSFFMTRAALAAARDGDRERAVEVAGLLAEKKTGRYSYGAYALFRAQIAALLGDRDEAIRLLRQALAEGYPRLNWFHTSTAFESIRDDPEYVELFHPRD
jgi:tetratricopeptide (TPR) repeat protein